MVFGGKLIQPQFAHPKTELWTARMRRCLRKQLERIFFFHFLEMHKKCPLPGMSFGQNQTTLDLDVYINLVLGTAMWMVTFCTYSQQLDVFDHTVIKV